MKKALLILLMLLLLMLVACQDREEVEIEVDEPLIENVEQGDGEEQVEDEVENKTYELYKSLILAYEDTYGQSEVLVPDNSLRYFYNLTGLCYAKLMDFTGDGEAELITVALTEDQSDMHFGDNAIYIWTVENEELSLLYSQPLFAYGNGGVEYGIELIEGDSPYIVHGFESNFALYEFKKYENSQFVTEKTLVEEWYAESDVLYFVDEAEVNGEQYLEEFNKYSANEVSVQILGMESEGEASRANGELEAVKQTLEKYDATAESGKEALKSEGIGVFVNYDLPSDDVLISQIDLEADDFLSTFESPIDAYAAMSITNVLYDGFSSEFANEFLVDISVAGAPHVFGLDRRIIAIFDNTTHTITAQISVGLDYVETSTLPREGKSSLVLTNGFMVNQGYFTFSPNAYEIVDGKFAQVQLFDDGKYSEIPYSNYASFYDNGIMKIYEIEYFEFDEPSFILEEALLWDYQEGIYKAALDATRGGATRGHLRTDLYSVTEAEWELYDKAYHRADLTLGGISSWVNDIATTEMADSGEVPIGYEEGLYYKHEGVAYADFENAMLEVFTEEFFHDINGTSREQPMTLNIGGMLWSKAADRGGNVAYLPAFDRYELAFTDDGVMEIRRVAYFADLDTVFDQEDPQPFVYRMYPATFIMTEDGYRVSEISRVE